VTTLVSTVVLGLLAWFLYHNRHYILESYRLSPKLFAAVAVLVVAAVALRSLANQLLFAHLGVQATYLDWFRLTSVTSFSNLLPFSAGLVAKALFLKRVHAMPYGRFAVGQVTLMLLMVATNGLVGLVTLALYLPEQLFGIVGAGLLLMLASAALLFVPRGLRARLAFLLPREDLAPERSRRAWPAVALCQTLSLLAAAAMLQLCFEMGVAPVGLAACLIFSASLVLTRLVTLTPGALGIREFLIGGIAVLTGFSARDAIIASSLARAIEVLVIVILGGASTWSISGELAASAGEGPPERPS